MRRVGDLVEQAARAPEHVDRRKMALRAELPAQIHVAVDDRADLVADRIGLLFVFEQHRVERRDAARPRAPGPLEQARQLLEHRGRIAAPRGRLPRREREVAQRARVARHRIEKQHHVAAEIAEILGDRRRDKRRVAAVHRRAVRRRVHDDRAVPAARAPHPLDELGHLAAALADQRDHIHVGRRMLDHHVHQRSLAAARGREDAETLADAAREQPVDRAHARREPALDRPPRRVIGRRGVDRAAARRRARRRRRAERLDDAARRVDDRAEQRRRHVDRHPLAGRHERDLPRQPGRAAERAQDRGVAPEAHHLRAADRRIAARRRANRAQLADRDLRQRRLDDGPLDAARMRAPREKPQRIAGGLHRARISLTAHRSA